MKLAREEIVHLKGKDIKYFWVLLGFLLEKQVNLDFSIICLTSRKKKDQIKIIQLSAFKPDSSH